MDILRNNITIVLYSVYCITCIALFQTEIIPFPYTKIPLGLLLGSVSAILFIGIMMIGVNPIKNTKLKLFLIALICSVVIMFIQKLLPLRLDEFHITTNVSRLSIITGILIGAMVIVSLKAKRKNKTDSPEGQMDKQSIEQD